MEPLRQALRKSGQSDSGHHRNSHTFQPEFWQQKAFTVFDLFFLRSIEVFPDFRMSMSAFRP